MNSLNDAYAQNTQAPAAAASGRIPGKATPEATKQYADIMWKLFPRISPDSWRIFEGGLTIGKVGFGMYRMDGAEAQTKALEGAMIEGGINLYETAATYTNGLSEKLLGKTLTSLIKAGRVKREQLVLITKAGYMQGEVLKKFKDNPPPETVQRSDDLWHCISPAFLKDQLETSLERLNVDFIEGYLLHNPEYFLDQCVQLGVDLEDARYRYYERIQRAFEFLEKAVLEGKIGSYGISSNTLIIHPEDPLFTDLAEVMKAAKRAAKKVHGMEKRPMFRIVQMPMNLLELAGLRFKNTKAKVIDAEDEPVSTLELASRMNLSVLTNRPLNAFPYNGAPIRLAGRGQSKKADEKVKDALKNLMQIERNLKAVLGGWPEFDGKPMFSFLEEEQKINNKEWTRDGSLAFEPIKANLLYPNTTAVAKLIYNLVSHRPDRREQLEQMCNEYQDNAIKILDGLRHQARGFDVENNAQIEKFVRARLDEEWSELPLQQIALHTIASIPAVTCVLCGLRQPDYLYDVMEILKRPNFADIAQVVGGE